MEYEDARKKLAKATYTSDLQTGVEENENIGSRRTKRYVLYPIVGMVSMLHK